MSQISPGRSSAPQPTITCGRSVLIDSFRYLLLCCFLFFHLFYLRLLRHLTSPTLGSILVLACSPFRFYRFWRCFCSSCCSSCPISLCSSCLRCPKSLSCSCYSCPISLSCSWSSCYMSSPSCTSSMDRVQLDNRNGLEGAVS